MKKFIFILLLILCQIGFSASFTNAFNSGELDPLLRYRVDLDKKYLGVETMENFLVKPQGAAMRRAGTLYVAEADGFSHLVSFESSTDDSYVLAFSNNAIRYFRCVFGNAGQIVDGNGDIYEISTVYDKNQIPEIQHFFS